MGFNPFSQATGEYKMQGDLGFIQLDDSLPFAAYKTDFIDSTVKVSANLQVDGNRIITFVSEPEVDITIKEIKPTLEKLFGGGKPELAKIVTKFIGKQGHAFIKEFQPKIAKQVSGLFQGILNALLKGQQLP